ncbi:MAG: 4Fe-4S dicluster domain-containing protein [Magnetospirillum sp.]|nr:4Fe-4S dicluster domain-containing protein [Magnetospirillum sp.]
MGFLKILLANLRKGPATEAFPFGPAATPDRYRGRVSLDASRCTGCRLCEHVCPGGAIRIDEDAAGLDITIWHNTCVFCGLCAHYCLSHAIACTTDWHLAHAQADKFALAERTRVAKVPCARCGKPWLPASDAVMALAFRQRTAETEALRRLCPDCRAKASIEGGRHVRTHH